MTRHRGPLTGLRVLEIAGIGPAPFGCMMLADLGADVILVDRPDADRLTTLAHSVLYRNRRRITLDLKSGDAVAAVLDLAAGADAMVEGFRPGVAERLGIGPEDCQRRNPALVYARMTGWGQDGPLAPTAGHDINYIALSGALGAMGPAGQPPTPPLNLLGDFGAGGMLLAVGILAAIYEARTSGRGQVVDAAIVDGMASLLAMLSGLRSAGAWSEERGSNLFDGGAPYYGVYECADGRYLAVGAVEPRFYGQLVAGLGLDTADLPDRDDPANRAELREQLSRVIRTKTRDEWTEIFAGTDACVSPVLTPEEAIGNAHLASRGTWIRSGRVPQPAPAPRFSRTPPVTPTPSDGPGSARLTWTERPGREQPP